LAHGVDISRQQNTTKEANRKKKKSMVVIKNHTLQDTVDGIYSQALASIPYALTLPCGSNPLDIYYYLQSVTSYENDKKGIEQIQKLQTMLGPANIHGKAGAGDCDCFTVAVLACLAAAGYDRAYIVLIGNSLAEPTHVYPAVDYMGERFALDLTAPGPGIHRTRNQRGKYNAFQPVTVYF